MDYLWYGFSATQPTWCDAVRTTRAWRRPVEGLSHRSAFANWTGAFSNVGCGPLGKREGTLAALHCLVCKVGDRTCALPLEHVREVMRPAAVERVEPSPGYLLGLAVIRGETVPVVDAGALLAAGADLLGRWVVLRIGSRRVAFGVSEVLGVRALEQAELRDLPPLLAGSGEMLRGLAVLDGTLLKVLASGWLLEVAARNLEGAPLAS